MSPGGRAADEVKLKTNCNPLILAIPATCDFCASTLMFIALTMVDASIYQMMRGIIVVITALFALIFLGKKQYRHHWAGIFLIIAGVAEVGYVAIAIEGSSQGGSSPVTGIILLMISQCFAGTMFVIEEKLLASYYLDPFKIVGTEGMWGSLYYLFALPIMQLIKCGGADDDSSFGQLCSFGYLENSSYAFAQMAEKPTIILLSVGVMASIACFNVCGITTTKYASAAQRSTIDTSRTVVIWIASVALGLEEFYWQSIIGFVLLVFGTLLYNEIIVLPVMGFDENTKEALAKREGGSGQDATNANYMAVSPGKGHQSYSRNSRNLQA